MKRKTILIAALCAALLLGTVALATASTPGSQGDPLISLQWLKDTFIPQTVTQAEERVDARTAEIFADAAEGSGAEELAKRGDVVRLAASAQLTPLSGTFSSALSGALVDLTEGREVSANTGLTPTHRYLVAENSTGTFTVTSDTAVFRVSGSFSLTLSDETDYNALAGALKTMGLFLGTDTPYGSGYDLERQPTRIQGLILFLRLLGEEQAALRYTGSTARFVDAPDWAARYVAYAYDKGYTKGVGVDSAGNVYFNAEGLMSADHYVCFLLRALSYQEGTDFNWDTAVADAVKLSLFTAGEGEQVTTKPFLRAQTVYLSYYALSAQVKGSGQTLLERLIASGAVDAQTAADARALVTGKRL